MIAFLPETKIPIIKQRREVDEYFPWLLFVYLFIYLFTYLFIHLFIYLLIYFLTYYFRILFVTFRQ